MDLRIEEIFADGASAEAPSLEAREELLRIIIASVLQLAGVPSVSLYRYVENDHPDYALGTPFQVRDETWEELDRRWLENLRLSVVERDLDTFIRRCAVAIRPGCHRGTIFADTLRIELHYEACEPTMIAWTLPSGISLDPDEHASLLDEVRNAS
jgi:hypothetical protein